MSNVALSAFIEQLANGLESGTLNTCSRWSSKRRVMGEPFPGPYQWKYHPWVREVHDTRAPENYIMKGAQLGLSEAAINRALYTIDQLRRDVLYVLPTGKVARDFSKGRFSSALLHSPYLQNLFTDADSVELKIAGTTNLYIRGSGGKANLVSIPVSQLILDEVDRMDQKEIELAIERLSGMPADKKSIWGLSTPTIPNYGVHKLFMRGTQEHYTFQCPSCSRHTELIWPECIEIIGESASDPRCHESYLKCKECKAKLEQELKPEWLKNAQWKATNLNANPDIRSFTLGQLYSYTVTPGDLVTAHFRGLGDEAAATEFYNSKLGLPFVSEGSQITDQHIQHAITGHGTAYTTQNQKPNRAHEKIITLGVDVGKFSYFTVTEWLLGRGRDVNANAHAKVIDRGKFLEDEFDQVLDELMIEYQVLACVIDSEPYSNMARQFARRFPRFVWLSKFLRGFIGKEVSITDEDSGAPLATCDRTSWFGAALGRFKTNRIQLPADVGLEYCDHLKAIVRTHVKDDNGNWHATYISTGPDHYGLSLVYSEIALPFAATISAGDDIERFM